MATSSVTAAEMVESAPIKGGYTESASAHLWCAEALGRMVGVPDACLNEMDDDIQDAIRYLLKCEIARARKAAECEMALLLFDKKRAA